LQREATMRELHEALLGRVEDACRSLIAMDDRFEDMTARLSNVESRLHAAGDAEEGTLRRLAAVEARCTRAEGGAGSVAARLQRDVEGFRRDLAGGGGGGGGGWAGKAAGDASPSREEHAALQEHIHSVDASVQQFSEQLCADMEAWQGSMRESLQQAMGAMHERIAALEQAVAGAGT